MLWEGALCEMAATAKSLFMEPSDRGGKTLLGREQKNINCHHCAYPGPSNWLKMISIDGKQDGAGLVIKGPCAIVVLGCLP